MSEIKIKDIQIVPIDELKPNKNNRNSHPQEQIEMLAKHYEFHGMRTPLIVSNQSGVIVAGNGRYLAAIRAGLKELPVSYQDFDTPEAEYSFGIADNGLSAWGELDLANINTDIIDLGPDFDLDMLGIKDFVLDVSEIEPPRILDSEKPLLQQMTFTVSENQADQIKAAIEKAKSMGPFAETVNENSNGNGLSRACEFFNGMPSV